MGRHETVHEARAIAENGSVRTEEGALVTPLASPLKPNGRGVTPEQLLAAGFAACLHHAAAEAAAADGGGGAGRPVRVETRVRLGRDGGRGYALDVRATVRPKGVGQDHWETIARAAEEIWPFGCEESSRFRIHVVPDDGDCPGD
ncbi:OsmC family protein [Marinactinospora thermotolerans]|uniref:OsmC family protein n=1 Tax=Marinactinospora thermotolerans TaxID=531310 RepID=UPI003D93B214